MRNENEFGQDPTHFEQDPTHIEQDPTHIEGEGNEETQKIQETKEVFGLRAAQEEKGIIGRFKSKWARVVGGLMVLTTVMGANLERINKQEKIEKEGISTEQLAKMTKEAEQEQNNYNRSEEHTSELQSH